MQWQLTSMLGAILLLGAGCVSSTGLSTSVEAPASVSEGSDFNLVVHIENGTATDKILDEIFIEEELYDGIYTNAVSPEQVDDTLSKPGIYSAIFEGVVIGAGSSEKITFDMNAVWAGDYLGNVLVCFVDEAECLTESVGLRITQ